MKGLLVGRNTRTERVRNAASAAACFAFAALCVGGGVALVLDRRPKPLLALACLIAVPAAARGVVQLSGFLVDREHDRLRFPGGGFEMNGLLDLVSPKYFLQYFLTREVPLSQIEILEPRTSRSRGVASYALRIGGRFGAVSLAMDSAAKMNQLYAAIALACRMASPVSVRAAEAAEKGADGGSE